MQFVSFNMSILFVSTWSSSIGLMLPVPTLVAPRIIVKTGRHVDDLELDVKALASRIREKYSAAEYISFSAVVRQHDSLAPGWRIVPGKGIKEGTVFDVVTSRRGDLRVDLKIRGEPVYTYQVFAKRRGRNDSDGASQEYLVREIDHRKRVMLPLRLEKTLPESTALPSAFDDHATRCASGGYKKPYVGPRGDVAEYYVHMIENGTPIGRVDVQGRAVQCVKYLQTEATNIEVDGKRVPNQPSIQQLILVDPVKNLVLGRHTQIQYKGKDPVIIRRVDFEGIDFPRTVNEDELFFRIPESARAYRVLSSGNDSRIPAPRGERE